MSENESDKAIKSPRGKKKTVNEACESKKTIASKSQSKNTPTTRPEQPGWSLSEPQDFEISKISEDSNFIFREKLNSETLENYMTISKEAREKKEPYPFPAIVLYIYRNKPVILGGCHRFTSAKNTGWTSIPARFFEGEIKDALRFAISDNKHGASLTRGDKKVNIQLALKKKLYNGNREMARALNCDEKYVRLIRKELEGESKKNNGVRSTPHPAKKKKSRFKSFELLFSSFLEELEFFVEENSGERYAEVANMLLDRTDTLEDMNKFIRISNCKRVSILPIAIA